VVTKLVAFFKTETGRRLGTFGVSVLMLALQGNLIPLDRPIPNLGLSVNQLLVALGINLAGLSGSTTRK
jgi:hypothetical protein